MPLVRARGHRVSAFLSPLSLAPVILVPAGLLAFARPAAAQGNAFAGPLGGRSALMGDTGVALGIDGAAPFLNPATIVRLDDQRFAFSVNFYNFSHSSFDAWHQPGPVDTTRFGKVALTGTGLTSSSFNGLPSTLCLFFTLADGVPAADEDIKNLHSWRQKLAICLGTTETEDFAFSAIPFNGMTSLGQTAQSQSFEQSWNRINIGPSYSVSVSPHLAFGGSVHGVYTTESYLLDSSSITSSQKDGGIQSALGIAGGGHSFDFSAIVGAIYSAAPYTVGLSLALPALHVFGAYDATAHSAYDAGTTGTSSITNGSGSFSATPPIRLAAGIGAHWSRITLELDESLSLPSPTGFNASVTGTTTTVSADKVTSTPLEAAYRVSERPTLTSSVGTEYFIKRDFSVLAGFSLNLSALPALTPDNGLGNLVQQKENLAIVSAGVGTYSEGSNLLLGFQLGAGWGSALAVNAYQTPNQVAVIDTETYSALLIISGTTNLRALEHAAQRIESVISGDAMPKEIPPPVHPGVTPPPPSDPAAPTLSPLDTHPPVPTEPTSPEAKPADAKPTDTKPAEDKLPEAKPPAAKPAEPKPAATKPSEPKPARSKPTDTKSALP